MEPSWLLDAEVESTPLSTTGGHTWAAARRLAAYLSAAAGELGLQRPGLSLLELGAGTGWLGVTVARNCPAAALVCLTEQAGGMEHLSGNVQLNAARGLPLAHVRVQPCDWTEFGGVDSSSSGAGGPGASACQPACQPAPPAGQAAGAAAPQQPPQQGEQQEAGGGSGSGSGPAVALRGTQWDFILGSDLIYNEVRGDGMMV